jgi:hypothetical protein
MQILPGFTAEAGLFDLSGILCSHARVTTLTENPVTMDPLPEGSGLLRLHDHPLRDSGGVQERVLTLNLMPSVPLPVPLRSLSERIWYGKACRLALLSRSRDASIQGK